MKSVGINIEMRKNRIRLFLIFVTTIFVEIGMAHGIRAQNVSHPDTILNRYRQYLIQTEKPENNVGQLIGSLNSAGQWADINYADTERAKWQPLNHLKRVRDLALALQMPDSPYYGNTDVRKAFEASLDHWLEKRYRNSNWWHNAIGIPQVMCEIIVLQREHLSPGQLKTALEILAQHRVGGSGANLIWNADLGFHYGALTNNMELMRTCSDLLIKEIRITTGDGIQPDYSYHQHDQRLQTYHYGDSFLRTNIRLAWECRETPFAFPKEKIGILTDFVLKGWQWMARGINTVPGTIDRAVSRPGELRSPDIRKLIPFLCELDTTRQDEFLALASRQNGEGAPLQGFRYYPYSDFSAFHTKNFSFFLKTISTRTLIIESINNENLKGKLLNSGDGYLVINGNEYFDLMPVWDWKRLPQITAFEKAEEIVRQDFTGSVSNGKSGLTVMDYQMKGTDGQILKAKKFWACHGQAVVCLIAGLETTSIKGNIYTTQDQCRLRGDVTVNQAGNRIEEGEHQLDKVRWVYHAGIAYIPLQPSPVSLYLGTATGSWASINGSLSPEKIEEKVFLPTILHKTENTGYAMVWAETPDHAAKIAKEPSWKVLCNNPSCQAVQFDDGTCMISFFMAGSVSVKRKKLTVDKPCLILISDDILYASNPAWNKEDLHVRFGKTLKAVSLPPNGLSTTGIRLK